MIIKKKFKKILQVMSLENIIFTYKKTDSIYLTFDDGPHLDYTHKILRILREYDIKATFFMVGKYIEKYPDILKKVFDEGHSIGMHSYDHKLITKMNFKEFKVDVKKVNRLIWDTIGINVKIYRPPEVKFKLQNILWSRLLGIKLVCGSWNSDDWKSTSSKEILTIFNDSNIVTGEILLFHDTYEHTVDAFKTIIPSLLNNGFNFSVLK